MGKNLGVSVKNLGVPPIVLLYWSRCRDEIKWMNCAQEEADLPAEVKAAGPAPGAEAWQDSWRALEQLYTEGTVAAIGVSNFEIDEMRALLDISKVKPMVYQGNIWSVVMNKDLMGLLKDNHVHFQVYNVMGGVVHRFAYGRNARNAHRTLAEIGLHLGGTSAQVVLRWLIQQGISVIPRSWNSEHVFENAAVDILSDLDVDQMNRVEEAVKALMHSEPDQQELGKDNRIRATFYNKLDEDVEVFWVDDTRGEQKVADIPVTHQSELDTSEGHSFVARTASGFEQRCDIPSRSVGHDTYEALEKLFVLERKHAEEL